MTTVALADDHTLLREGLRRSLELGGLCVVGEAGDGAEAVALAQRTRPDVILMDVSLPVLDGVEAARRITASLPGTRVLMLTMYDDAEVMDNARRAGVAAYLLKDCSSTDILAAIRQAIGEAVDGSDRPAPTTEAGPRPLSRREVEVLQLIASGCSTSEVGSQLFISFRTVKNHLVSIFEKLECRDRTQAVVRAAQLGLVSLERAS